MLIITIDNALGEIGRKRGDKFWKSKLTWDEKCQEKVTNIEDRQRTSNIQQ